MEIKLASSKKYSRIPFLGTVPPNTFVISHSILWKLKTLFIEEIIFKPCSILLLRVDKRKGVDFC